MEQETPQKLLGGHSHQPLFALVRVVLPAKSDLAVDKVDDPVVGNGDAMRVAGQIMENVFGSSEWPFSVNNPVVTKQRSQKSMEGFRLCKPFHTAGEPQFPLTEARFRPAMNLPRKTRLSTLTGRKKAYCG